MKTKILHLTLAFILGYTVSRFVPRYYLQSSNGKTYRINTITGSTCRLYNDQWQPVAKSSP